MSDVKYNEALGRYEQDVDGHTVFATVRNQNGTLFIDYVEAPPVLRGTGAAGRFMDGLMKIAAAEKLKVVPICGYAAGWLRRHNEYNALLQN